MQLQSPWLDIEHLRLLGGVEPTACTIESMMKVATATGLETRDASRIFQPESTRLGTPVSWIRGA